MKHYAFLLFALAWVSFLSAETVRLQVEVNDGEGRAVPCRVHLANDKGKTQQAKGLPFFRDHFTCNGRVSLNLEPGKYNYAVERGPEFERLAGTLILEGGKLQTLDLAIDRIANLREAGWFSADLHVHRPLKDIGLIMRAEDLDFAPVITWWNKKNFWDGSKRPEAGEDEREGGALIYHRLKHPLEITKATQEVPSPMHYVEEALARKSRVWIDIEKPFWWDVPVWLASGKMNSIGLANNHMCRSWMLSTEAWGKPRDENQLPAPLGNAYWTQEIYYHLLNVGLRLPPSAGSASGVLPNPVGHNRVYVKLDGKFSVDAWWQGLAAGRCFVANGPLLVAKADGQWPGAVLKSSKPTKIRIEMDLTSWDRVSNMEIVQNGKVVRRVACREVRRQEQVIEIEVKESGWFLIRAISDDPNVFRFASTGPFYLEIGETKKRISRASSQFFLDWVDERIERVRGNVADESQRKEVLQAHQDARRWWRKRIEESNAK